MLATLEDHHTKIPSPTRSKMISMPTQANAALRLDGTSAYNFVWVSNPLDGSEDHYLYGWIINAIFSRRSVPLQ